MFVLVRKFAKSKLGRANQTRRGARPRQDADMQEVKIGESMEDEKSRLGRDC